MQPQQTDLDTDIETPKFGNFEAPKRAIPEPGAPKFQFAGQPEEKTLEQWEATPKMEVAKQAASNLVPSAINAIKAVPEAIINYEQTGQALKQIGSGVASKVQGYIDDRYRWHDPSVQRQTPEEKQSREALLNAMLEPYQSVGGFKKAIATDPFSVLTTASIPLTYGGAGAVKAGEILGKSSATAGKVLQGVGKTAEGLSYAVDPVKAGMGLTGVAYERAGLPAVKKLAEASSGVPAESMELAYQAGRTGTPAIRDAFNTYAKGLGNPVDFSRVTAKAAKDLRAAQIADWASNKQTYMQQMTADVPLQPVFDAIQQQRNQLANASLSVGPHRQALTLLSNLERKMININNLPAGHPLKRIESLDKIKQDLYDLSQTLRVRSSQNAAYAVHSGVIQAINDVSPEYGQIMSNYQRIVDGTQNIARTLGVSDKVAANAELSKFLMQQKTPDGRLLIEQLAQYDPRIPYMVAGASINNALGSPSSWGRFLVEGGGLGLLSTLSNPLSAAAWATSVAAGRTLGSPEAVSQIPYLAGRVAGSPVGTAGRAIGEAAEASRQAATGVLTRKEAAEQEYPEVATYGDRTQRASGGRITAEGLINAAERAKKDIGKSTETLLKQDDSTVAHALEVANRQIED